MQHTHTETCTRTYTQSHWFLPSPAGTCNTHPRGAWKILGYTRLNKKLASKAGKWLWLTVHTQQSEDPIWGGHKHTHTITYFSTHVVAKYHNSNHRQRLNSTYLCLLFFCLRLGMYQAAYWALWHSSKWLTRQRLSAQPQHASAPLKHTHTCTGRMWMHVETHKFTVHTQWEHIPPLFQQYEHRHLQNKHGLLLRHAHTHSSLCYNVTGTGCWWFTLICFDTRLGYRLHCRTLLQQTI